MERANLSNSTECSDGFVAYHRGLVFLPTGAPRERFSVFPVVEHPQTMPCDCSSRHSPAAGLLHGASLEGAPGKRRGDSLLRGLPVRVSTESTVRANEQSLSTSTLQESRVLLVLKRSSDVVSTFVEVRARKRGETVVPQLRERRNTSVVQPAPPPGGGTVAKKESFILPVAGQITSPYGKRASRFHDGIDIPAPVGPPIVAAKSGRVVFSGSQNGFGKTVTIDHGDGTITRYSHNSVNLVKKGDTVLQGQPIAKIGRTGRFTCDHLHLTLWVHGKKVNPAKYFPY